MNKTKIIFGLSLAVILLLVGALVIKRSQNQNSAQSQKEGAEQTADNNGKSYFLKEVSEKEVIKNAARPDAVEIGGKIYLVYKSLVSQDDDSFKAVVLDSSLGVSKSSIDIYPSDKSIMVTDIRASSDNADNLWYAYESVFGKAGCGNHLVNGALYNNSLNLISSKTKLSTGCTSGPQRLNIPLSQIPKNPQIADDPTPFFYGGKYYILSRAWDGSIQHMRVYDQKFNQLDYFTLDISKILKSDELLSQNSMVEIDGKVYIVGGIHNGPPMGQNTSYISAIPLSSDLKNFDGKPTKLTSYSEYDTRVTSAKYNGGILYINYHNLKDSLQYLEAFDVKNNFKSLGRAEFQDGLVGDGHSSFVIINNKMYLFYPDTGNVIKAKIIEIGETGGKIDIKTTKSTQNQNFIQQQSPQGNQQGTPPSNGKCGDGVCDDFEKKMNVCPQDCK